jgi:predicted nucleic acid-binding protein
MRLAVFDTNVVVSAGLKLGSIPYQLVMDWVLGGQVQMVTCPGIIAEYREVLNRAKFSQHRFPPDWLDPLIDESLRLPDPPRWQHSLPDPKDAVFLSLAHVSGGWLVTGNLKHFPESARQGVTAVGPGEYLRRLEEG